MGGLGALGIDWSRLFDSVRFNLEEAAFEYELFFYLLLSVLSIPSRESQIRLKQELRPILLVRLEERMNLLQKGKRLSAIYRISVTKRMLSTVSPFACNYPYACNLFHVFQNRDFCTANRDS